MRGASSGQVKSLSSHLSKGLMQNMNLLENESEKDAGQLEAQQKEAKEQERIHKEQIEYERAQLAIAALLNKPTLHPGEFFVNEKIIKRAESSLCGITNKSKCRKLAIKILENKWFDNMIMLFILLNSIAMAMNDYESDNRCAYQYETPGCYFENQTRYNQVLNILGRVFLWIFAVEAVLKIFALGAFCGHKTYFKNVWNILDFVIVVAGIVEVIMEAQKLQGVNMRALRILRILRPLKAMKTLPNLRKQITALLMSVLGLVNVAVFLAFIFFLSGVIGLQWFVGAYHYACRTEQIPTAGTWQKYEDITGDDSYSGICTPEANQLFPALANYKLCPAGYICGSPLDHGLSLENDGLTSNSGIQYGIGSFDNIGQSLLAVFQIITLDSWSVIAYNLADYHAAPFLPILFCVMLIFMGSYFLLNLFLAVVMESYMESEIKFNEEVEEALRKEEEDIEERFEQLRRQNSTVDKDATCHGIEMVRAKVKDRGSPTSVGTPSQFTATSEMLKNVIDGENKKEEELQGLQLLKRVLTQKAAEDQKQETEKTVVVKKQGTIKQALASTVSKQIEEAGQRGDKDTSLSGKLGSALAPATAKVTNQSKMKRAMVLHIQKKLEELMPEKRVSRTKRAIVMLIQKKLQRINMQSERNERHFSELKKAINASLESNNPKEQVLVYQRESVKTQRLLLQFQSSLARKYKIEQPEREPPKAVNKLQQGLFAKFAGGGREKLEKLAEQPRGSYGIKNEKVMVNNVRDQLVASLRDRKVRTEEKTRLNDTHMLNVVKDIKRRVQEQTMKEAEAQKELEEDQGRLTRQKRKMTTIVEKFKEKIGEKAIEHRAEGNKCYSLFYRLAKSRFFEILVSVSIVSNTILLGLDKHPQGEVEAKVIEYINLVFYVVFFFEMVTKLIGFGLKGYFTDYSNAFDLLIVLLSTIDVVIFFLPSAPGGDNGDGSGTMSRLGTVSQVFRIFRLLRVFKLAKSWTTFNYFLRTMGNTLKKISTFTLLMYLFIFMYTILGMEMFSNGVRFDLDNQPVPAFDGLREDTSEKWDIPNSNFNDFLSATTSVFIVLANDGWTVIQQDFYRASSPALANVFCLSLVVIGQMILFNLFISMLLQEFDDGEMIEQPDPTKPKAKSLFKRIRERCCSKQTREAIYLETPEQKEANLKGKRLEKERKRQHFIQNNKSLGLFSEQNQLRIFFREITNLHLVAKTEEEIAKQSHWFDNFIMLAITVSSILLALESPLNDPDGMLAYVLLVFDYSTTVVFTLEVGVKVIASGFLCNGEKSYLRNSWNVADFLIVVISVVSLLPLDANLSVLKVIRMIRLLRPLRVISKNENLKLSIQALVVATPAIMSLLVIFLLVMFIFGIIAVNLFKGKSFDCDVSNIVGLGQKEIERLIETKQDCLNYGGTWVLKHYHFDNIQTAVMNLVIMSQTVNWAPMMYSVVNSGGPEHVSGYKNAPHVAIFFIVFIIFGAFFMTNLFVGVVINAFNKESDRLGKDFLLTDKQKSWIQTKVLLLNVKPRISMIKPVGSPCREFSFKIATHTYFEIGILVAILLNSLGLCVKWPNMAEETMQVLHQINYFFTGVFCLEFIIKILAFGTRYFKDNWNRFDFLIVVTSVTFIIIAQTSDIDLGTTAQVIRTLRVSRMLKFFSSFKQMKIIFATFIDTLPSLLNVGGLLFLIIYIFAVIGISLFADIKHQPPMHARLNFQNIFNAYITLIRMSSGEGWNDLMNALGMGQTLENDCIESPTYQDYVDAGAPIACGNYPLAFGFFFLFLIVVTVTFLNLFIAIILSGYFDARDKEKKILNTQILDSYQEHWSHLDPNAKGEIPRDLFAKLMFKLKKPLGWDKKKYKGKHSKQATFTDMIAEKDPNASTFQFSAVLDELALVYVLKQEVAKQTEGMDIESSEEEDLEALNERKSHLQFAETMKEVKMVKDMLVRAKTGSVVRQARSDVSVDQSLLRHSEDGSIQLSQLGSPAVRSHESSVVYEHDKKETADLKNSKDKYQAQHGFFDDDVNESQLRLTQEEDREADGHPHIFVDNH